jgi:simple sugar transport system ATP-binding protein/ribose transport system ATP-binding protein
VFLGIEDRVGPVVRGRKLDLAFQELVERTGIEVQPGAAVRDLPVADQQKVEILRALARHAELVVMDEPTARLTANEASLLKSTIRRLAAAGTTVVFVSHFLEEVLEISDRVTVMRDGGAVRTGPAAAETRSSLIHSMIGRDLDSSFPDKRAAKAVPTPLLKVGGLTRKGVFSEISFEVGAGEIVVLAGLVGAGRSEVVRTIYGADHADSGTVHLSGQPLRARRPRQGIDAGLAMIPEERKTQGLQLSQSVERNITLPYLKQLSLFGVVRRSWERQRSQQAAKSVGVKTAAMSAPVTALSGGNQQKVLFARSLFLSPKLLIADEPTRGVDVAAKRAIYDLIVQLAASGSGVLVVSSELEEVIGLAHRVIVMSRGRIVAELRGEDITEANIMERAFGAVPTSRVIEEKL